MLRLANLKCVICAASLLATLAPFLKANAATQGDSEAPASNAASGGEVQGASSAKSDQLQEVLVTAEKRTERLQDVPIPVSVINTAALTANSQVRLTDYYSQVPGLAVASGPISTQTLSIRGITTGAVETGPPAAAPTVGITVDDVPFGGSGGGDTFVPDFDPGDLARIEVLRGPQGTLYGASSMGGLIKFVTLDPSTDAVSGRLAAGTSGVYNGTEPGYNFRGALNVPLSGDFAIRVSGFFRQDPGYIDNPVLGVNGVNEDHAYGGHLEALWRPSGDFSLKVSALYQRIDGNGTNDVTPNPPPGLGAPAMLGDLQQYYIRGVGSYDREAQAYSAVLTYKMGSIDLTSLTGYNVYRFNDSFDITSLFAPLSEQYFGQIGTPIFDYVNTSRFTQEFRLTAPLGPRFDTLVGVFYSYEKETFDQSIYASNPSTGEIVGHWFTVGVPSGLGEFAGFADLTWHPTDRFDIQFGARGSQFSIVNHPVTNYGLYYTAILGGPSETVYVPGESSNPGAFTYLLTPRFKISPDLMVYARVASGYRAGGNNFGTPGVPPTYHPDTTKNYEIGTKGDFLDNRISVDASLYYIDWKDLQLSLLDPSNDFSYTSNASAAKSEGVELSIEARPTAGLKIAAWMVVSNAELTQDIPGAGVDGVAYGFSGDRLPYVARFTGNLAVDEAFPVAKDWQGSIGATVGYVSSREDVFPTASPQRQYLPPYAKTDLRAGVNNDLWTVNLYANNVADKRGLISGGLGNLIPYSFYYIQPRTVGLSVERRF